MTPVNDEDEISFSFDTLAEDGEVKLEASDKSLAQLLEVYEAVQKIEETQAVSGWKKWFIPGTPYGIDKLPRHYAFFEATKDFPEVYFSAGNRCGKTLAGAFLAACHLTGEYPGWFPGRKFDHPVDMWAVGDSRETTRDALQKELMGDIGKIGTGMLPAESIKKVVYRPNGNGAIDYALVEHKPTGGVSKIAFKSSEQGITSFYGAKKDVIWMDELPPADIYSECYLRTLTTGGMIYVTATPLAGLTPLVLSFYNNSEFLPKGSELPGIVKLSREDARESLLKRIREGEANQEDLIRFDQPAKATITAGWDHCPWIPEEAQRRMLDATPPHMRESRRSGLPSMGSGSVFTVPVEEILVTDFEIPKWWRKIAGLDVGWNCTAATWMTENPDTGVWYLYSEHKQGGQEPTMHAKAMRMRGDWIPIAIDPASRGRSQVDGKNLFNIYRQEGLKVFPADNAVEAGIFSLQEAFATGKLKVFKSCTEFVKEYVTYRRDEKGRIVKQNDHVLDAARYNFLAKDKAKRDPVTDNTYRGGSLPTAGSRTYDI